MDTSKGGTDDAGAKAQRRAKPGFTAGHFFLLVLFVGGVMLVLTDNVGAFANHLYSPFSVLILVVIGAMYLLQEGSDRSRMYRLELREMRRKRLEDLQFYRKVDVDLTAIAERMSDSESATSDGESAQSELEQVIDRMRERN